MLSFFGNFFSSENPITMYLKIGLVIIFVALVIGVVVQYNVISSKNEAIGGLKEKQKEADATILALNKDIGDLRDKRVEDQQSIIDMQQAYNEAYLKYLNEKSSFEKYKNENAVVYAKTSLVEKKANAATLRVFNEIDCITGNCNDKSIKR